MKKITKSLAVSLMALLITLFSIVPAFAAKNLTVNGVEGIKKGDIITYTLSLADCEEDVIGLQMYVKYDKKYLEVVTNSVDFPVLEGVVSNPNSDNGILFNWTNIDGADFSKKNTIITVDFRALKGGETDVQYFVGELYGMDMTYMKNCTFTYDLAVNDKKKVENEVPPLVTDKEFIDNNQGAYVNYADGKGEKNGKESDKKRETVKGETTAPTATYQKGQAGDDKVTDVTKGEEKESFFESDVFIYGLMILIVLVVAGLLILQAVLRKKEAPEETTEENLE